MLPGTDKTSFNPFPGLRPFTAEESHLFFGRKNECDQVAGKLLMNRYVTIIGESGTGKTSLISAGVVPALKDLMKDQQGWRVFYFQPGNDPFTNLANAIESQLTAREKAAGGVFSDNPDGITGMIRDLNIIGGERILIVLDQLEDLFIPKNSAVAGRFIDSLVRTVAQSTLNIYVIVAMRAEFISECARFQGLTHLVNSSSYLMPPITREGYREVIEGPITLGRTRADSAFVSALLDDIGEKIELPVLQHALMRTWQKWMELDDGSKPVSKDDYESAGTVKNAISVQGDEIYLELNQKGRIICERIFRTITGESPERKWKSRPATVSELMQVTGCRFDEVCSVIDKFRAPYRNFLIPGQNVPLGEDTVINISHDCLAPGWGKLRNWIEAEEESVKMYLKLSGAAALYQQGKAKLLKQPDLQLAVNWRNKEKPVLEWARRYDPAFERAMVYLRTSETQFHAEEEGRLKQQRTRLRRIRILSGILGTAAIIAAVFMIDAMIRKTGSERRAQLAEQARIDEEQRRIISDSAIQDAERRIKLSEAEASRAASRFEQTNEQLQAALNSRRQDEMHRGQESSWQPRIMELTAQRDDAMKLRMVSLAKAMSLKSIQEDDMKDLQSVLSYQAYLFNKRNGGYPNDADIYAGLYNIARKTGTPSCRPLSGYEGRITGVAFVPGKNEFYTSGTDGKVLKWNLGRNEKAVQVIYSGPAGTAADPEIIDVMAISPDEKWLACGISNKSIRMIPLSQQTGSYVLQGHTGTIKSLLYSYDGKYLYSAALDGKVLKWDLAARTSTDISGGQKITSIDISSRGSFIAGISSDGKVLAWDPEKQSGAFRIEAEGREIRTIRFNPENNILAVGDESGQVDFYDVQNRRKISSIKAHSSSISDIRFNTALNQVATAGTDGKLKLYDFSNPSDMSYSPVSFREESFITILQFSPDGRLMLTGSFSGELRVRPTHADYLAQDVSRLLTRNLSSDEWNMYVAKDIPPEQCYPVKDFSIKVSEIKN